MKKLLISLLGVVMLSTNLGTGCTAGADAPAAPAETQIIRVIIPDWSLRSLGTSCAGAGPYRFAHAEASFLIKDGDGKEVARGELPTGTSEKAMDVDFSKVKREPTVCVMLLEVDALEKVEEHLLVIEGRPAVPIKESDDADIAGEAVIS